MAAVPAVEAESVLPPLAQRSGQCGFAYDAAEQPDGGDADLDGGKKARRIFAEMQGGLRAFVAFGGTSGKEGLARRDQRDFRHGEKAVENDEDNKNSKFHDMESRR